MHQEIMALARELHDRHAIEACLLRYCRGIDRLDRELMLSAYHDDAIDDHGLVVLSAADFVDWAIDFHRRTNPVHHHAITNLTIDLEGDVAHTECYYSFFGTRSGEPTILSFGRYVDRFERRDGLWGIATRFCFTEAVHELPVAMLPEGVAQVLYANGPQDRSRADASYLRPLLPNRPPANG